MNPPGQANLASELIYITSVTTQLFPVNCGCGKAFSQGNK